jgi:pimeloyl-ACP methyl ester carboxylesterase
VNPSFPLVPKQAHQAIEQMRDDPRPLDRPLVVISGFFDPNISPLLFKCFFKGVTRNATIIPVSVGFCGSFAECRRRVIEAVDKACPSSDPVWTSGVDVVGASLGGLVARFAAAPSPDPANPRRLRIARLFSISSPHSGAKLAEAIALTDYHRDIRPGSAFLKTLAVEDAEAAYQIFPYVHLNDEIVGDRYAAPPGKTVYWLPNDSLLPPHAAAMIDERILADIARRLRDEPGFTISPAAPLPD